MAVSWSGTSSLNCGLSALLVTRSVPPCLQLCIDQYAEQEFVAALCSVLNVQDECLQAAVTSVAFDGVNGTIASGSKDKTVRLWQPSV